MSKKVAYVTGGMGGIGTAICQRLHNDGYTVIAGCGPTRDFKKWIDEQKALGFTFYSSVNGNKGQSGQTNYSAAKAGMHGFTMALAQELASKGVTVNTVSPGYIGTDMVRAIRQDILDKIVATIPVKRLGTPDEIGSIVGWLAGDQSGFTTGADFSCNGGLHMG
jgi:NAD(P)-dependent dehydrogenase (short-subunit alcohol dehydrogenase family)